MYFRIGEVLKVLIVINNENDDTNPFFEVYEGIYKDEGTEFVIPKETLELMNNNNACIGFISNY